MKASFYTILFFFSLIWFKGRAQDLKFQRVTMEDGLTTDGNWASDCIHKDVFGFLWIATSDGLNRWDGYEVETFRHDPFDSTSIGSNAITSIVGSDEYLYIGTADIGLIRYNYRKSIFERMEGILFGDKIPQINNLQYDAASSTLWIANGMAGFWSYAETQDFFSEIPIKLYPNREQKEEAFYNATIRKNGEIALMGTGYVYLYNPISKKTKSYLKPDSDMSLIAEDQNGDLWVSSKFNPGVWILNTSTGLFTPFAPSSNSTTSCISKGPNGKMWYGYTYPERGELKMYDPISLETFSFDHDAQDKNSFPLGSAISLEFDAKGNLWYMTNHEGAGHAKIDQPVFEKLTDTYVNKILSINKDSILFTSGKFIKQLDLRTKEIKTLFSSDNDRDITSSYMDEKESIYFTVRDKYGVYKLEPKTGKNTHFNKDLKVSFEILEKNEKLWTTHNLGFIPKETGDLTFVNELIKDSTSLKLPRTDSYAIEFLSESEIALATLTHGFYVYNIEEKTITQYDGKNASFGQLSNSHIITIHKGQSSNLIYVATSADLNIWDRTSDTFSYINEGDGLKGKIESMFEDSNQNLWVQTTEGLHHIKDQKVIARYGEKYSLNSGPTFGNHSMIEDDEGMIYVSTAYALFKFDPKKLEHLGEPNHVIIKDLYLKREKVKPSPKGVLKTSILYDQEIVLDYNNRDIGFSYVSPFERESELAYYYRLIGYDTTWINNKDERIVHFTNLDQGNYTFQVKAKSANGKWTPNATSISFEVKPPWYATWWSFCIYALSIFSIIYSIFRYRIHQLTKYQKLRTKISSDLHDDVGTLLSSLAMQSDVLGLDAPPEKLSKYEKFSELSREAMSRMRDTVWAIDSRKDNMDSLVDRMSDYIADMYEDQPIKVSFMHDQLNLTHSIAPDIRQNVYLIFKEAINNAMKYSNGDKVKVTLQQTGKRISLSVKDNGTLNKGKTSGTGMSNMKMRAKRIGGTLEILTEPGFEIRLEALMK